MRESIIVWDLETVPDLSGFAAANQLVGKTDDEVREALGDKFPKHIYHSVVCIGALIAHREPMNDAASEASERNLIECINARATLRPHLAIETKLEMAVGLAE